jgi:hypothetical protein
MKYTTKNQNEFENLVALHINAFDKRVSQESNLLDDVVVNIKGHQRISNMICFLSLKQDIAVPMACLYLLRNGSFYKFHEFKHILFTSNLLWVAFNYWFAKLFAIQRESPLIQVHVCVTRGHCSTCFYSWTLKPQLFMEWQNKLFANDFGTSGGKCLSHAQKITLDPRKLLKWHLGSCYWLLVAINYNYTSLSHWWNFWVYNTCFIHFIWNTLYKNALPWPSFKSWTST